jgi:hypothetical protein
MRQFLGLLFMWGTLLISSSGLAQNAAPALSTAEARAEVEAIFTRLTDTHPNLFWHTPEAEWRLQYDRLMQRTGPIDHIIQYFDLSAFMALAFDTHVQIYPEADTPGFGRTYPIRFRLFEEGLYVTAAHGAYADWVGSRVTTIAGQDTAAILDRLEAFAFADNALRKRSWAAEYLLLHPATYRYQQWMQPDGRVPVTLVNIDGGSQEAFLDETVDESYDTVSSSGANAGYYWPAGWRTLHDLSQAPVPLSRTHLDSNYWFTEIEGGRMIYAQLNRPFDQEDGETFLAFSLRLFSHISTSEQEIERLILDIRYDLGGSISGSLPLAYLAQASDFCCQPGGIVLLIGRETISAGSVLAGEFERTTRPVMIGEPTGSSPNIYLNHEPIPMPHSGLFAEASTWSYTSTVADDQRMFVAPDIDTPERVANILAGRDPALEAAISLTSEQAETFYTRGRRYRAWIRPSQDRAQPDR